jgi:hypothetical protein
MKSALYFDSAKGFGEWHILISARANQFLRQTRRTNTATFKIVVKKIKLVYQFSFVLQPLLKARQGAFKWTFLSR